MRNFKVDNVSNHIRKWEIPDKYIPEVVNNGVKTEFQGVLGCDFQAQPMPEFSSGIWDYSSRS